jgi:hypothetical protein
MACRHFRVGLGPDGSCQRIPKPKFKLSLWPLHFSLHYPGYLLVSWIKAIEATSNPPPWVFILLHPHLFFSWDLSFSPWSIFRSPKVSPLSRWSPFQECWVRSLPLFFWFLRSLLRFRLISLGVLLPAGKLYIIILAPLDWQALLFLASARLSCCRAFDLPPAHSTTSRQERHSQPIVKIFPCNFVSQKNVIICRHEQDGKYVCYVLVDWPLPSSYWGETLLIDWYYLSSD